MPFKCTRLFPAVRPKFIARAQYIAEFFGKGAHAAAVPWEGVNALDALVGAYTCNSMLRQQLHFTTRVCSLFRVLLAKRRSVIILSFLLSLFLQGQLQGYHN